VRSDAGLSTYPFHQLAGPVARLPQCHVRHTPGARRILVIHVGERQLSVGRDKRLGDGDRVTTTVGVIHTD
jgi:hypothetical protein